MDTEKQPADGAGTNQYLPRGNNVSPGYAEGARDPNYDPTVHAQLIKNAFSGMYKLKNSFKKPSTTHNHTNERENHR
jgi:hypothetical protein